SESLHCPRRQVGILVPGTPGALALETVRERGAPVVVEDPFQRHAAAFDVRSVVVVAGPRRVVGHGGIDPGPRRELVVDEAAMGVAEGGHSQAEYAVDDRQVQKALIGPVILAPLYVASVEVQSGAECAHVRLIGDVTYGAGHGTGAKRRTLRAVQHFN